MNSLFGDDQEQATSARAAFSQPLAARMRPRTIDEIIGHEDILGPARPLRRALDAGAMPSLILWGPPGSGKTTLAEILARSGGALFVRLSAVSAGVADLRRTVDDARRAAKGGHRTVVFIDEIHRFNRAQQDVILPHVEDGTIVVIGATTENPSFEVNAALLSRARVIVLKALSDADIERILQAALEDRARGYGELNVTAEAGVLTQMAGFANGDARTALNTLEFAVQSARRDDGTIVLRSADVIDAQERRMTRHDKSGEAHFDTISAFIKSMRGSDPDAAVYWLARMLEGGEDPIFVARRLLIFASEDIGLADSAALPLALAAAQTAHMVGMPEAHYALAHATLYLATAPKGNTVGRAYAAAVTDVQETRNEPVPLHLRNAPTSLMRELGYGRGYRYAHDEEAAKITGERPPAHIPHAFRPENIADRRYFAPGSQGAEAALARWNAERYARADVS